MTPTLSDAPRRARRLAAPVVRLTLPLALGALALAAAACAHRGATSAASGPAVARSVAPSLARNAPQRMEGCYALKMTPWSAKTFGVYVAPPGPFRLDTVPGVQGEDGSPTLRAHSLKVKDAERFGQYSLAAWRPVGDDSLDVAWANDTHGVTMRLGPAAADTLRGEATAWTTMAVMGAEPATSQVTAWRMRCG